MTKNIASVTKLWVTAQEGFTTTSSATVVGGVSTTVPLNSVSGYTDGDIVTHVIDPLDSNKKQVYTGTVDLTGMQVTNVKWTEGTDSTHTLGATVVDYETATAWALYSKGLRSIANDDGTLKTSAVQAALNIGTTPADYTPLATTANAITYNGNHSYNLTIPGVDYTDRLNPGTRLRSVRTVAAPTQSTSLNGTNQYWSKTSPNKMTFTDDFVVSAWVKLSNYPTSAGSIVARTNGTNGWAFRVLADGRLQTVAYNGGAANVRAVVSNQSMPLNKWVHVTAQVDMSSGTATTTTNYMMFDGVDVPVALSSGGTNPTTLVQAGDLTVGMDSTFYFPGKIGQVAVFNAKVTQATIRGYISQGLVGNEANLSSAYSFNGVATDLNTTTPNDLTANGAAVATNADSPFGGQANGTINSTVDYAVIMDVAFSTNTTLTVQVPEGCTIPTTGGVSALSYSAMATPYGLPGEKSKWRIFSLYRINYGSPLLTLNQWYATAQNIGLSVPIGKWSLGYEGALSLNSNTGGPKSGFFTLSPMLPAVNPPNGAVQLDKTDAQVYSNATGVSIAINTIWIRNPESVNAMSNYLLYCSIDAAPGTETFTVYGGRGGFKVVAENPYV